MNQLLKLSLFAIAASFFGLSALASNPPVKAAKSHSSTTVKTTQQAQDSANGSMTDTDLTGNVDQDTSALSRETTSGTTTSGAIIDNTETSRTKQPTTEGLTPNDEVHTGRIKRAGPSTSTKDVE